MKERIKRIAKRLFAYLSWEEYKKTHPTTKFKSEAEYADALGIEDSKPKTTTTPKPTPKAWTSLFEQLPKKAYIENVSNKEDFYKSAEVAQEKMLDWLDKGKGIDKEIGAKHYDVKSADDFKTMLDEIDKSDAPVLITAPIKGEKRATEKVNADYNGNWSELSDGVRASIAVKNYYEVDDVVEKLLKSGMSLAKKPKDRFTSPTVSGYRDMLFTVKYDNGHIGELQLHTKSMIKAKETGGHKLYEEMRSFTAKAKSEKREEMSDDELEKIAELYQKQRELYEGAWNSSNQGVKNEDKKTS